MNHKRENNRVPRLERMGYNFPHYQEKLAGYVKKGDPTNYTKFSRAQFDQLVEAIKDCSHFKSQITFAENAIKGTRNPDAIERTINQEIGKMDKFLCRSQMQLYLANYDRFLLVLKSVNDKFRYLNSSKTEN